MNSFQPNPYIGAPNLGNFQMGMNPYMMNAMNMMNNYTNPILNQKNKNSKSNFKNNNYDSIDSLSQSISSTNKNFTKNHKKKEMVEFNGELYPKGGVMIEEIEIDDNDVEVGRNYRYIKDNKGFLNES